MDLSKIISISGKPGLFKVVGEMKNGVVVEGLEDSKRFPAMASQQVSTLEDISIYTKEEDLPLGDVLTKIKEKLGEEDAPDPKTDPEVLKKFFTEVLPDYDDERVYVSDIKKVVRWYNALNSAGLITVEEKEKEEKKEEGEKETEKVEKETEKAEAPAKDKTKNKGKKDSKKTEEVEVEAEKEEAPAEDDTAEE